MTFIFPRSHKSGLTLSTAGGSASFGVTAGQAADSTNAVIMNFPTAVTKTASAWAAGSGNGALDTGTVATSTWYHVHLICSADGQTTDILLSLSATTPTLPTGYTLFRRIGSMKTTGSSLWQAFTQKGKNFVWTGVGGYADYSNFSAGITNTSLALPLVSVPSGVSVKARFHFGFINVAVAGQVAALASGLSDAAYISPSGTASIASSSTSVFAFSDFEIDTNTSAAFFLICGSAANNTIFVDVTGWVDTFGMDD